jgi:hypothetical protein
LLSLLQHAYGGKTDAFEAFQGWLKANDIPYQFDSYA